MKFPIKKDAGKKIQRAVRFFRFSRSVSPNVSDNKKNLTPPKRLNFFSREIKILQRATREDFLFCGSFYEAIGPVLVLAQLFGILPVIGVKSKDSSFLHFKWFSIRTIYSMISSGGLLFYTSVTIYWSFLDVSFDRIAPIIFYTSNSVIMIYFIFLAKKWPKLMKDWNEVECNLPPYHTQREKSMLARKMRTVTILILTLSMIEHLLSIVSILHYPSNCPVRKNPIKDFFYAHLSQLFFFTEYSPTKAFFGKIINIWATFTWSFMDLFVILISIGLSSRFKQLNECLMSIKGMTMPHEFWSMQRINFRNLSNLCENIDNAISIITMISFSNNLFFICVQLLNSLNPLRSIAHGLYFWFSLLYLIGRTLAVSLYAAEIYSESKRPVEVFRVVPRESWCQEVKRFSDEVSNDRIALSGMKFFYLTRGLVLSVAGTIVTYELVLIQFHEVKELNIDAC